MKPPKLPNTQRLRALRAANDAAGFEMAEARPRFVALASRHEDGTAPRAVTAHQLFQTPPEIAALMVQMLNPEAGARVLEPSAGLGRLLDALAPFAPSEIVAVEIAPDCAHELRQQARPGVTILQRDFLTVLPDEIGHFDAVVMNPPFTMRSDIRHIRHALDFLKPGGRMAALCLDTHRRESALRHDAIEWMKLPAGAFKAEGTNVPAILATFSA